MPIIDLTQPRPYKQLPDDYINREIKGAKERILSAQVWLDAMEFELKQRTEDKKKGIPMVTNEDEKNAGDCPVDLCEGKIVQDKYDARYFHCTKCDYFDFIDAKPST